MSGMFKVCLYICESIETLKNEQLPMQFIEAPDSYIYTFGSLVRPHLLNPYFFPYAIALVVGCVSYLISNFALQILTFFFCLSTICLHLRLSTHVNCFYGSVTVEWEGSYQLRRDPPL